MLFFFLLRYKTNESIPSENVMESHGCLDSLNDGLSMNMWYDLMALYWEGTYNPHQDTYLV